MGVGESVGGPGVDVASGVDEGPGVTEFAAVGEMPGVRVDDALAVGVRVCAAAPALEGTWVDGSAVRIATKTSVWRATTVRFARIVIARSY